MTKNNKLKVEAINKYFYPVSAGIEVNILNIYGFMAKNGWDITIHTSKDTLTEKNILPNFEKINGVKLERYPYRWFGFWPKIGWNKSDLVSLHNFNIFPHLSILLYCLLLKLLKRKGFTLILSPHGGFNPDWETFPKIQALIKRFYHYTLGTFLINKTVDGIRAVSEWEKQEMVKHGVSLKLIKVISNGVENEAFVDLEKLASKRIKSIVSENQRYIVQIGRIHPIKNYETTIMALTKLPKNLNYLIVGTHQDTLYKLKLESLIKKLKLDKRVKLIGEVKGVDKYYLIKHAELMVHMASWESFCNTVHEGMSQGLVCIVSNKTNLPYLVRDGVNGYVLDAYDYEALAEKIRFVLENKNSAIIKGIQKRNIQFAKNHSWQNVAKEVEDFYLNVIN